jgi:hypothetical protein
MSTAPPPIEDQKASLAKNPEPEKKEAWFETKIKKLEAEVERLLSITAPEPELEVWTRDKATQNPDRWRKTIHTPGEFKYIERIDFHNDSGYSSALWERPLAMIKNACGWPDMAKVYATFGPERKTDKGQPTNESTYKLLPLFDGSNVIEITYSVKRTKPVPAAG